MLKNIGSKWPKVTYDSWNNDETVLVSLSDATFHVSESIGKLTVQYRLKCVGA